MIVWSIMSWSVYEPESCVKNNRERCLGLGQMGSLGHLAVAQNPTFYAGFYAINQRRRHGGKHELEYHEHSVGHRRPMLIPPALRRRIGPFIMLTEIQA